MPSAFLAPHGIPRTNLFSDRDFAAQRAFFAARPHLAPTPLHRCPALAASLGLRALLVKDETARFGLNAFKATGALFAVDTLRARGDVREGDILVCASEGNHGRAVARAARDAGCRAIVYMSASVSAARVAAIRGEGADVVLVPGTYDDAVRQMAPDALHNGWTVISDTSWSGYSEIPRLIVLGYTRILDEVAEAASGNAGGDFAADVIFVPAGVGGLLAAVACWCDRMYGRGRPRVVAVEPAAAACVQASVRAGAPTRLPGPFQTVMGGLRCGEMSPDVFPVAQSLVDAYLGIEDEHAFEAMRRLARPQPADPAVSCGPSGAAALGGLLAVLTTPALRSVREPLRLGPDSRVLVLVTEGVTDPPLFAEVLARP